MVWRDGIKRRAAPGVSHVIFTIFINAVDYHSVSCNVVYRIVVNIVAHTNGSRVAALTQCWIINRYAKRRLSNKRINQRFFGVGKNLELAARLDKRAIIIDIVPRLSLAETGDQTRMTHRPKPFKLLFVRHIVPLYIKQHRVKTVERDVILQRAAV